MGSSLQSIATVVGFFISFGVILAGIGYLIKSFREGAKDFDNEEESASEKSNMTLRELIGDQDKKIAFLISKVEEADKTKERLVERIEGLEKEVAGLTAKKTDMENMIVKALENYFMKNPNVARDLKRRINNVS